MPEKQLKSLLNQLHEILEDTDKLDAETRELVAALDDDIDRLLDEADESMDLDTFREGAQSLEARFRSEYPAAGRFLQEIMDMLAKVGI